MDFIKFGKVNNNVVNKAKKNILNQNNISEINKTKANNHLKKDNYDSDDDNKENIRRKDSDDDFDKSKSNKNVVKRPIICICNDLYAKVLMPLRKEALVFNIKADPAKLEKRIRDICIKESLNIDQSTIKNLCKQTNFDIRACINTLQFISYNQTNAMLLKTLSSDKLFMIGSKDIGTGLFEIWNKVFTNNKAEMNFNSVLHLYNSYGEFEKINEGIFVNYVNNPVSGLSELSNRAKLLDYLSYDDIITSKIHSTHNYELSKFQILPGAYSKLKYSSNDKNKNLKFPSVLVEYKKSKKFTQRILSSLKESYDEETPNSRIGKKSLVCDTLPFIFQLIQPEIREINPELMNSNETKALRTAINIMCQFGIKFFEGKSEEDLEMDQIYEPDIHNLLNFNEKKLEPKIEFRNNLKNITNEGPLQIKLNYRISSKHKFIIKSEYERIKHYNQHMKEISKGGNLSKKSLEVDALKMENLNPFKDNKKNNVVNNMNFGKKRNFTQFSDPEYKFVYKFNEGVTNSVRRSLNLSYFFKK
jgi:chromosome transmission fidelity protein 18